MAKRENGGIVGEENLPTQNIASGIWGLNEVLEARKEGLWPGSVYQYPIGQSLRFDGTSYLSRLQTTGSRTTMTYSLWVKRSDTAVNGHLFYDGDASSTETSIYIKSNSPFIEYYHAPNNYYNKGYNLLRDLSAWYHLVFVIDTSNSTTAHRMRIYINSVEIVSEAYSAPTLSLNTDFNENGSTVFIGARTSSTINFNGYMANIQFIDGQALDASSFGELVSGVWVPKAYTGTYGTNGFHLDFADPNDIGNDVSGNNNDWTVN